MKFKVGDKVRVKKGLVGDICYDGVYFTYGMAELKGNKTVTAEAKCAPEDEFDFGYGAKLAMDRAIEKMEEEEIGYSWVKCVGYRQKHEFNFTVGKKYKIYDNGTLVSDDDFNYGMVNNSKKETLDFISNWYIFEEV